jgi:hypothetical protein
MNGEHPVARLIGTDSHTKWIVGFVSLAIVGLLGTLLKLDRDHISRDSREALLKATAVEMENAVLRERLDANFRAIREDLAEIKEKLE